MRKSKSDANIQEITRYRKETLEINKLISQNEITEAELKRLKQLLLQDATDRRNEKIALAEWEQILEARVVVSPSKKELSLLAQMLSMV